MEIIINSKMKKNLSLNCRNCDKSIDILLDLTHIPFSVSGDCIVINQGVKVYKCSYCKLIQKKSIDKLQKENFKDFKSNIISKQTEQMKFIDGKQVPRSELIVNKISEYIMEDGKILDIGTGNGAFLKAFQKRKKKWKLFAQDIHANYENEIMSLVGSNNNFFNGDIELIEWNEFDLVSLNHVLIHVVDLNEFIKKIHNLVKKKGNIIIQIADIESNPFDVVIMDQINHFSKYTLNQLLKKELDNISFCNIIPREISVIFGNCLQSDVVSEIDEKIDIDKIVDKLKSFIDYIYFGKEKYIVFGTAPFSIYLGAILGESRLIYFLDEDKNKIDKKYLNKDILKPVNEYNEYKVILPFFSKNIINDIEKRYSSLEFITYYDIV